YISFHRPASPTIYTLSLHDALPISHHIARQPEVPRPEHRAVDREVPDERDGRAGRPGDPERHELGIECLREATSGDPVHAHARRGHARLHRGGGRPLDRRDDRLDEGPPYRGVETVERDP